MTLLITKKHLKEFLKNKANVIYASIMLTVCGIIIPIVSVRTYFSIAPILILAFISQISPALFVGEKENKTLETLITLPIRMKTIYIGKVLYSFFVSIAMLFTSYLLGLITCFIINVKPNMFLEPYNLITFIIFIPLTIWNLCYHAAYFSLKANDARVCTLTLTFVGVLYSILPVTILTIVAEFTDQTVIFAVYSIYVFINVIIFIAVRSRVVKYFDKPLVFSSFRN